MKHLSESRILLKGFFYLSFLVVIVFAQSCKKDKNPEFDHGTNEFVNDWILDSMKVYYYWTANLPKKPNYSQDPRDFFSFLKYTEDRFSQLVNPDIPDSYPKTLYSEFGLDLVTVSTAGSEQTLVSLVVPGSDGDKQGLKRGDRILGINGTLVNASNINSLIEASLKKGDVTFQAEGKNEAFTINGYLDARSVYGTRVWDKGGRKIGYIFLNNFDVGAISRLKEVFADFQNKQVSELILDMRYNIGGEVSVATALAAMMTQASEDAVFLEYRGNSQAGVRRHSFGSEISKVFSPVNYSQYINLRLNLNRVFILTGRHTASAAELLANNLPPYIETTRIGEATLGKDMASFEIKDYRSPKLSGNWVFYPMVFKVYNAQGKGDYSSGLQPDLFVDELSRLPLKEFGDPDETLTRLAISRITGIPVSARVLSLSETSKKLYDSRIKVDENISPIIVAK